MANLEETHEADLDVILGELSILEQCISGNNTSGGVSYTAQSPIENVQTAGIVDMVRCHERTHRRSNSIISGVTSAASISSSSESGTGSGSDFYGPLRQSRNGSPDNDSAFSDTVSLMSSTSSSASSGLNNSTRSLPLQSNSIHVRGSKKSILHNILSTLFDFFQCDTVKAAKIHLALHKLEQTSIRRLFVKAFTCDGASKSLLVDESMSCGTVTRLLADKNHVRMDLYWTLVEHWPDLQMGKAPEKRNL